MKLLRGSINEREMRKLKVIERPWRGLGLGKGGVEGNSSNYPLDVRVRETFMITQQSFFICSLKSN